MVILSLEMSKVLNVESRLEALLDLHNILIDPSFACSSLETKKPIRGILSVRKEVIYVRKDQCMRHA